MDADHRLIAYAEGEGPYYADPTRTVTATIKTYYTSDLMAGYALVHKADISTNYNIFILMEK